MAQPDDAWPDAPCRLLAGECAVLLGGGFVQQPSGVVCPIAELDFAQGSCLRFHYDEVIDMPPQIPAATLQPPSAPGGAASQPAGEVPPAPASPASEPAEQPVVEAPATATTTSSAGTLAPDGATDVTAAADAAAKLGGDYAPIVAIVLAAIAVLGGSKAWSFYKERSAQRHELELKRLEVQAQATSPTVQPPPCQAAQAKVEAELAGHAGRIGDLERRTALAERKAASMPDVDVGELDERLTKLEKAAKRKTT